MWYFFATLKDISERVDMAKNTSQAATKDTGIMLVISYVVLFAINAIVLYLANRYFPMHVVLGTHAITPFWAIVHSMGTLALINTFAIPFVNHWEKVRGHIVSGQEWMGIYLVLNFVGIWAISRYSEQFGLGVSAWYVALALAVVLDVVQGLVMMQMEKMRVSRE